MSDPVHSVVMPVLNGTRFIGEALQSALCQLGPDDEILVVDNGSTDGTRELVGSHPDSRVKLLVESTRGPAAARNTGLSAANGTYVSFMDHDDLWPEGRQSGLLRAISETPDANAAYGRLTVIGDPNERANYMHLDGMHVPDLMLHPYLFRRELLDTVGLLNEALLFGEDTDYIVRLRVAGMRCAIYDGMASVYRRHEANITNDRRSTRAGQLSMLALHIQRQRKQP